DSMAPDPRHYSVVPSSFRPPGQTGERPLSWGRCALPLRTFATRPHRGFFRGQVPYNLKMKRVVYAACPHDCPDACGVLITIEDGRATRIQGDPEHPVTRGFLCA